MKMIDADTVHGDLDYPDLTDDLMQIHRKEPCTQKDVLRGDGGCSAS